MATKIFFCYAHEDELYLMQLKTHLRALQRQGLIDIWHDRDISAGSEWAQEIDKQLNTANIILLLVSADFMNSDYCYSIEMKRAMERHERGEARVIPVILRPVYWHKAPFGKLQALPTNAQPIVSSSWHNWDEAFFDVAEGIRNVVIQLNEPKSLDIQARINLQDISDEEKLSPTVILANLRKLYVLSHDNISPGVMAGTEPLPKEWVEKQLEKMGETWRQDKYYVNLDDDLNRAASITKATSSSTKSQESTWQEIVTANLKEFVLLWTFIYGKDSEKLINPFLTELQTKLILISEQLIRMLSWNSRDIPKEATNNIGGIASRIESLGRMQFYLDGGLSAIKFNEIGDYLVKDVESLIEQLNSETK
jgi:TIR domain